MNLVSKIVGNGCCIGCGLCEDIGKDFGVKMVLDKQGFYVPSIDQSKSTVLIEEKINKICPGINVNLKEASDVWGSISSIHNAWSTDPEIRKKGSSGGVITGLCVYLINNKNVDAILQVGKNADHFMYNSLQVSRTREEILSNASSRYAPALVLNEISTILNLSDETFAFVGKPCDIVAIKNYLKEFPEYGSRIKIFISIFCAGMPSYNATLELLEEANQKEYPYYVKYRGDGWPGNFEAHYSNGNKFKKSYNDSWGNVLGKNIHFRCKICPDGIGLFADIVAADSWETKDGYPDFEEKEGKSLLIARNEMGKEIIQRMIVAKVIEREDIAIDQIKNMQPYQYLRRFIVGYRILAIKLCSPFALNFTGFQFYKMMMQYNPLKGIRISLGTAKRFLRR